MAGRLRIATFNLENLDDRTENERDFLDRVEVLRPQFLRLRADVVCLQEVNAREQSRHGRRTLSALDHLLEGSAYDAYDRMVSVNRDGKRFSDHHNLVILSRHPIVRRRQVWHDLVPPLRHNGLAEGAGEIVVEWDRPLLHAEIETAGGIRVHVVNVHLRAPRASFVRGHKEHGMWTGLGSWAEGFFLTAVKRAGQALEARLAVEQIFDADPHALVAVCGDFNAEDREIPVRTIRGDEEDTGNGHLATRSLIPVDRGLPDSRRYSVVHRGRRLMLDHILVSRPLLGCYSGCEVHNEALGDEVLWPALVDATPDSFHAPLVAEFLPA